MLKRDNRPYKLREYDPSWKERYQAVAERIKPILGDSLIGIEHIGSTSIEGMLAKPQIDVLAVVTDLSKAREAFPAFIAAGFEPKGAGYVMPDDEYVVENAPDGSRLTSIHILQQDNPRIAEYRIFRDYLRQNKANRELYAAEKRKLYAQYKDNFAGYDTDKVTVVSAIKVRAKAWAEGLELKNSQA